jgi:hypothetical protein
MKRISQNLFIVWFSLVGNALAAGETPLSFTLDGTLYDSPAGTHTLVDSAARVRVQILPPSGSCVLYDEEQTVNTTASDGAFNIQVGTAVGSGRRVGGSDSGNAMAAIFQNNNSISGNAGGCTYSPVAGDVRRVRVIVTPTSGSPDTLTPDMVMSSVPSALVADTLQGVPRAGFLQLGAGSLSQSNVENVFSSSNYTTLTSLLAGTGASSSGSYAINAGTGGSGGIDFNVNGSTKAAIANNGNFSVDSGSFFVDAASNRVGIGTSTPAASLDLGAKTDAVILPSGTTAQRPSPASAGMIRFNASNGKLEFHDGTSWANLGSDISGITAGGDLSGTYPNPGVAKIRGQAVSANASLDGQVMRFDGSAYTPAFVAMGDLRSRTTGAAALTSSCTSAQTLTWNSVTDTLTCTNIAALDAGVITTGTIAAARLPTSVKQWDAVSAGINYAGGFVGIGSLTPTGPLDVAGGTAAANTNGSSITLGAQNAGAGGNNNGGHVIVKPGAKTGTGIGGSLLVGANSAPGWVPANSVYAMGGIYAGADVVLGNNTSAAWGDSSSYIMGATSGGSGMFTFGTSGQPRLTIDSAGRLGIGTTLPSAKLSVTQAALADALDVTANSKHVRVDMGGNLVSDSGVRGAAYSVQPIITAATNYDRLLVGSNVKYDENASVFDVSSNAQYDRAGIVFKNGGAIAFLSENSDRSSSPLLTPAQWNSLTRMTIAPSGNVGIGSVTPAYPLDVNGTVNATAYYLNGAPFTPGSTASTVPATGGSSSSSTQSSTNAATGDRTALLLRNNGTGGAFEYNLIGQNAAGTTTSSIKQDGSAYFGGNLSVGLTSTAYGTLSVGGSMGIAAFNTMPMMYFYRLGSAPTAGTQVGGISIRPSDGSAQIPTAGINAYVTTGSTVSTGSVPTDLTFHTGSTSAVERVRITSAGSVTMSPSVTDTSGTVNPIDVKASLAPTAATSAAVNGISSQLTTSSTNNFTGGLTGVKASVTHSGSGTANDTYGVYSAVNQNHSSGTSSSMYGTYNDVTDTNGTVGSAHGTYNYLRNANSGTVANMYGTYAWLRNVGAGSTANAYGSYSYVQTNGTGVVTNGYGFYSASPSVATANTLTNYYGLYIQNPTAATNNYSIYSAGGLNYFAGKVGIGSSAPGNSLDVTGTAMANTVLASNAGAGDAGLVRLVNTNSGGTSSLIFEGASNIVKSMLRSGFSSGSTDAYLSFSTRGSNAVGERMRIDAAGNVGIGSVTPGYPLDVNGTVNATAFYLNGSPFTAGSSSSAVATTGGTVASNIQTGTNAATADRTALTLRNYGTGGAFEYNLVGQNAAGTTTSSIKQDGAAYFAGNVSIGTSSSTYGITLNGSSAQTIGMDRTSGTGGLALTLLAGGGKLSGTDMNGGTLNLSSGISTGCGNSSINFNTSTGGTCSTTTDSAPSTKMTLTGSGRLGIGSTSPTQPLDVNGMAKASRFIGAGSNNTPSAPHFSFNSDSDSGMYLIANDTIGFATNGQEKMRFAGANLGIGTTNPIGLLHVNAGAANNEARLSSNAGYVAGFTFADTANGLRWKIEKSSGAETGTNAGSDLAFSSWDDTGTYLNIPFFIKRSSGFVGIGTNAPTAPLHVANASSARILLQKTGDHSSEIYDDGDMHINSANRKLWVNAYSSGSLILNQGGGNVGIGNVTSPTYKLDVDGDLRITGVPYRAGGDIAWTVPSDARLKDVKGSYDHGLDAIAKLRTVRFHYKEGNAVQAATQPEYIGVIAQEVQKVIPEAVSVNPKNGFLNLNSSPIFWSLVNATKELKDRCEAGDETNGIQSRALASLQRDHAELKQKAQRLEAENNSIKAYLCAKDPSAPFCRK